MRKLFSLFALMIPVVLFAQQPPAGFDPSKMMEQFGDPAKMAAMMQQAQKMQACMAKIDEEKIAELERRGEQMQSEVQALCATGDEGEALEKAIAFGKEISTDPVIAEMQACAKGMTDLVQGMPGLDDMIDIAGKSYNEETICSSFTGE